MSNHLPLFLTNLHENKTHNVNPIRPPNVQTNHCPSPRGWHSPDIYSDVAFILSKHGYPTISLPLPSVGAVPAHEDFTGDVEGIRSCLTKLVSEEKEVVLVVHSVTGVPGQQAAEGLGQKERMKKGLMGGVTRYVVINGVVLPEGYPLAQKGDYSKFPGWMKVDVEVNHAFLISSISSCQTDIFPEQYRDRHSGGR
jgi:hypothetical protein